MKSAVFAAAMSLAVVSSASADTITIDASLRGWVDQDGTNNGATPDNNFIAGNCGVGDCDTGEFRNWFSFDLSGISDQILSAELVLGTASVDFLQASGSAEYSLTSFDGNLNFNNLGTGTAYGSRDYVAADDFQVRTIALNAAAVADINAGGTFMISGRVTEGANFGPALPNQFIFGSSQQTGPVQLVVELVPAPGTLAGVGLLGLGLGARRRR